MPLALVGACLMLAIGAGFDNARHDARDRAAASGEPRFQRPLEPTADRVLFMAQNDATNDFYMVNADGSQLTRLTWLPRGSLAPCPPTVSPDRTRLAINAGGVSIVRLDGSAETTPLDRPGGSLAWSPDGARLASLRIDDDKRLHLFLFNADGTGEVLDIAHTWPSTAAGDEQSVGDLTWSPDARRLAFVLSTRPRYRRHGPRHTHLFIAHADGSSLRNLSLEPHALPVAGGLSWSPDGRRLAFRGGRGIGMVDVDLAWSDIPIAVHGTRTSQYPAWSPDGTRLAWFSPDAIVTSDPDGGRQDELTRGRCRGVHPSWSADGRRIAFACADRQDRTSLFVMNADGSGLTEVTSLDTDTRSLAAGSYFHARCPVWLPADPPPSRRSP